MNMHAGLKQPQNDFAIGLRPGDYFVYEANGLCVVKGVSEKEFGGIKTLFLDCSKVGDQKFSLSIPKARLGKSSLRPPASFAEIEKMFAALQGNYREDHRLYKHKEADYKAALQSGDLIEIGGMLKQILGKDRATKSKKTIGAYRIPDNVTASMSDRVLIEQALDVIVPQLAFRCGLSRDRSLEMVLGAALKTKNYDSGGLKDVAKTATGMSAEEFQKKFGRSKKEAGRAVADGHVIVAPPTVPGMENNKLPAARSPVQYTQDPGRSNILPPFRKSPPHKALRSGRRGKESGSQILPGNKIYYTQLLKELPSTQHNRVMLNLAGRVLDNPVDFILAGYAWLVHSRHRKHIPALAQATELSVETVGRRLLEIKRKLTDTAKAQNIKAIERVTLSMATGMPTKEKTVHATPAPSSKIKVPKAKKLTYRTAPILDANKEILRNLDPKMPAGKAQHMVLKLAAQIFDDPLDVDLAAHAWLVARKHKQSIAQMAERFELPAEQISQRLDGVQQRLTEQGAVWKVKAVGRIKFEVISAKPKAGKQTKVAAKPVLHPDAYKALEALLPSTLTNRSVFNLAARTLSDAQDFEIASRLWLITRTKRASIQDIQAQFNLKAEETTPRLAAIARQLRDKAAEKGLKSIDRLTLYTADKTDKQKPQRVSVDLRGARVAQEGDGITFSVTLPAEILKLHGGLKLDIAYDAASGQLVFSGSAKNKAGERRHIKEFTAITIAAPANDQAASGTDLLSDETIQPPPMTRAPS